MNAPGEAAALAEGGCAAVPASHRALSGSILPTFAYYAVAAMIGLVAITTTSLVDGAFVGNYVGSDALAAVSLLIPGFTALYAIALMLAIGGSVSAGMHIGEGDEDGASAIFSQTLFATMLVGLLFAVLSTVFEAPLFELLNVPPELTPLVHAYFGVWRWVLVVQLTTMVLYYYVRADGHPVLATSALVIGAASNIAFNALFVIHLDMGLRGSACATAISQLIQGGVLCTYFLRKERTLRLVPAWRRLSLLVRAAYMGVAEFINEISAGAIIWLLNDTLMEQLGVEGVAAFSVVNYFIFLSLMMSYGIADALHLLVSQNYGAGERQRIRKFLATALACSFTLGVVLTLVIGMGRSAVTGLFLTTDEAHIAVRAADLVTFVWPLFLVNVTNIIFSCYLTAVDKPGASASIALLRGLVLPASLLVTLPTLLAGAAFFAGFSQEAFLAALPIAEWVTFGVGIVLVHRHRPAALTIESAGGAGGDLVAQAV